MVSTRFVGSGCLACLLGVMIAAAALGQDDRGQLDLAGRPIADIKLQGLSQISPNLVRNQIRSQVGSPYDPRTVEQDIQRITRLGHFRSVKAQVAQNPDNTLDLTFVMEEQLRLRDVRVVGNKRFSDEEILGYVGQTGWEPGMAVLRAGDAADAFLIERSIQRIEDAYQKAGYFQVDVDYDEKALTEKRILQFRVREGALVTVRGVRFEGNTVFSDRQLEPQLKSKTRIEFIIAFRKGHLDRDLLDQDVAAIRDFYRNRGYLEAEVGRRVDISPDEKDAIITYVIDEGPLYTVASIEVEGNTIFSDEQVKRAMPLKVGDVFAANKITDSEEAIENLYGKLGYIEMQLRRADGQPGLDRIFHETEPKVDVVARITEVKPYHVGKIEIRGNDLTKDRVILREIRGMDPGRRFDRAGIEQTKQRLRESPLFQAADVTVLGSPEDDYRDVLIDVKEVDRPGSINLFAGVNSNLGLVGGIQLQQRNFDWQDWPDDFGEVITGKAFRGAGQSFSLTLQPGTQYSDYSFRFVEPYMFDTGLFLVLRGGFRELAFDDEEWDEERLHLSFSIGQAFGDVWQAQITPRFNRVNINDVEPDAPTDVFAVEGGNTVTGLRFSVTRDTRDSRIFPTTGSILDVGIERVGVFGGDFDFTTLTAEWTKYWKVDEDFLGRPTILKFRVEGGLILENDEAPFFERFYAGGFRSFRGFERRGVGPRGVRMDTGGVAEDAIGGDWLFLMGLEYEFPIVQEYVRGVAFIDTGTVQDDIGFDEYRVSIGAGIRLRVPFLGNAPIAFDLAFPLVKESNDETEFFHFDLALPF